MRLASTSLLVPYFWPVMFWNILLLCWGTPTHYLNRQCRRKENVVQLLLNPTLDEFFMFMKPDVLLQESSAPVNSALYHSNPALQSTPLCANPIHRSSQLRSVPFQSSAPVNPALCHSNPALQSAPLCANPIHRSSQLRSVPFQSSAPVNSALCQSNPTLQLTPLCAIPIQRSS